jgi:hypothetical protein
VDELLWFLLAMFVASFVAALWNRPPAGRKPAPGFQDRELMVLPGIPFTGKMATEGIFVTAELGWGKTWLTFMRCLEAYLPAMGGVILGHKAEDAPEVEKQFAAMGALDRLVMLGPRYGNRLNWFESLVMFKHLTQRMILRRRIDKTSKPVALMFDEAQTVFVTADRDYQAVCRSKLGCSWAATQNLTGLYAVLGGGPAAEAQAKSWLALFGCKIFGSNTCWASNSYASELCGQQLKSFLSGNTSQSGQASMFDGLMGRFDASTGWSERYEPIVRPEHFVRLRKPEPPSYEADAIVVMPRLQQVIGRHWAKVTFRPEP